LLNELEAFRDAVEGRPAQVVTLAEGVDVVRVGEAVLRSAREGRTVEI
jgi:predicted dehydrogenase